MYDYVDGKIDWMSYGLPVEGEDGPFLGDQVVEVATCLVTLTAADARQALDSTEGVEVILVDATGLAVGEVDAEALDGQADDVALLDVLKPVPGTVRPSVTVASVAEAGGGERLVTTSDGRLLGRATGKAAAANDDHDHEGHDHEGHDHEGHDHSDSPLDMESYEQEMTEVMKAVADRFGDQEPSADELRGFLKERLVADGRSDEEAEQFLEGMDLGEQS